MRLGDIFIVMLSVTYFEFYVAQSILPKMELG